MNQLTEPAKVAPKLIQKLSVSAPSKLLVEKYLIAICRCANVPFEGDEKVMREDDDEIALAEKNLGNFVSDEPIPSKGDGIGWSTPHSNSVFDQLPQAPTNNINHPGGGNSNNGGGGGGGGVAAPFSYPTPKPNQYVPAPTQDVPHLPPTQMAPTLPHQQVHQQLPPPMKPANVYPHPECGAPHMPVFNAPMPPTYEYSQVQPKNSTAPSHDMDHIYEVPPGENNSFDFDFPMPPSDDHVSNFKPSGGEPLDPGAAVDDLARRFDELKKRT